MKEILGSELSEVMKVFNINATRTYYNPNSTFSEVWELDDKNFTKLWDIDDNDWKDEFGWWRCSDGSNLGCVHKRYNINNHYIYAWDGTFREEQEEENLTLPVDDRWYSERKYHNLIEYISEEIGASTEKNVTAIAIDLAKQNNIKLSELFHKYKGEE